MIAATETELAAAGITDAPEVVLADAGYWHQRADGARSPAAAPSVLIPPDAGKRKGARPGWDGGLYAFMRRVLATDRGGELYAKRQGMIEPIFADTKFNRRCDRFQRRGRAACRSEWRLITATHNLLKLWRHTTARRCRPERPRPPLAGRFRGSASPPTAATARDARHAFTQQPPWKPAVAAGGGSVLLAGDCRSGGRDGERGAAGQSAHAVPMQGAGRGGAWRRCYERPQHRGGNGRIWAKGAAGGAAAECDSWRPAAGWSVDRHDRVACADAV